MRSSRLTGFVALALGLLAWGGLRVAAVAAPASASPAATHASAVSTSKKAAPVKLVDINSASRAQLKALPGIGDAEADRIIAGRPYRSKADLAAHKVLPTGIYLSLKSRIIARQRGMPTAKT